MAFLNDFSKEDKRNFKELPEINDKTNDMSDFGESPSTDGVSTGEGMGISDGGCCFDGGEGAGMSGGEGAGM